MVPVDLPIDLSEAAAAEQQEPGWWSGFSAPNIQVPDISPQEVLEYFMEVAILKILKLSCTGFVKVISNRERQ